MTGKNSLPRPPFGSRFEAVAYILILVFIGICPFFFKVFDISPRWIWSVAPRQYQENALFSTTMFEDQRDIDVLFIGNSNLWTSIDANFLEKHFSEKFGRPIYIANMSSNWHAEDKYFLLLKHVLSSKKVKFVFLTEPLPHLDKVTPHEHSRFWWNHFEHSSELKGLAFPQQIGLYVESILAFPRWFLGKEIRVFRKLSSETREGVLAYSKELGSHLKHDKYDGKGTVTLIENLNVPDVDVDGMIFHPGKENKNFKIEEPFNDYMNHWREKTIELCHQHGCKIASVGQMGAFLKRDRTYVQVRKMRNEELQKTMTYIGIPHATLFGSMDDETAKLYFSDYGHVGVNGARLFTRALAPALDLYLAEEGLK